MIQNIRWFCGPKRRENLQPSFQDDVWGNSKYKEKLYVSLRGIFKYIIRRSSLYLLNDKNTKYQNDYSVNLINSLVDSIFYDLKSLNAYLPDYEVEDFIAFANKAQEQNQSEEIYFEF